MARERGPIAASEKMDRNIEIKTAKRRFLAHTASSLLFLVAAVIWMGQSTPLAGGAATCALLYAFAASKAGRRLDHLQERPKIDLAEYGSRLFDVSGSPGSSGKKSAPSRGRRSNEPYRI